MKGLAVFGIVLLLGGLAALIWPAITVTHTEKAVDLGPIEVTTGRQGHDSAAAGLRHRRRRHRSRADRDVAPSARKRTHARLQCRDAKHPRHAKRAVRCGSDDRAAGWCRGSFDSAGRVRAWFTGGTMRVDYFHSGGKGQEIVALDRVVSDGPWPGSRTRLVDDLNLGKYLFEVIDRETNRTIYSRGFASVYGEWETTAESRAAPHVQRVAALSVAEEAGAGRAEEARPRQQLPRDLVDGRRSRTRDSSIAPIRRRPAACGRSSRTVRRRRRSTSCSSARATPRRRCRSSTPT